MYWRLERLIEHSNEVRVNIGGAWIPARPYVGSFKLRLVAALDVLMGKADAVKWPNNQ